MSRVPHDCLPRVRHSIAVRIRQTEQVGLPILGIGAIGIERGAVKPNALAVRNLVAHDLLRLEEPVTILIQQPGRVAAFLGDNGVPLGIERDLNQRPDLIGIGDGFDDESGRHLVGALQHRFGELTSERD